LFVVWELVGTEAPAVDLRILGTRAFASAWATIGIIGFGLLGGLVLQSLFLQQALGYTAAQTGLAFLPRGLVTMLISPAAGVVTGLIGPRFIVAPGVALAAAAMGLMSRWTLDAGPLQIVVPMLLLGLALSFLLVPLFGSALGAVERRKAAGAAGLMNLMFQLGGSFGTAILTTMLERGTTLYHARLIEHARPDNPAWTAAVRQVSAVVALRGGADAAAGQQQALAALDGIITGQAAVLSFEHAFQVIAALFLIGLLAMPFLPARSRPADGGAIDL
jgi:DHA2 family multidrug resistance protein